MKGDIYLNHFDTLKCRAVMHLHVCVYFAYIYYEAKWQGCHSETPSQVGVVGQQEPYENHRGQMRSPATGKEETLAAIQAGAACQGCILSGSSVAQQQLQGHGAGAERDPVLAVPSPMRHSSMEMVTRPVEKTLAGQGVMALN